MQQQLSISHNWKRKIKLNKLEKLEKEFRILEFNFAGSPPSPLFLTAVLCANGRVGQAHVFSASGISARVSMAKGRVPDPNCNPEIESESYTLNTILKNVEWGWRGQNTLGNPRV